MSRLRVTYRMRVADEDAEERAEAIALEQSVEVPRSVVRDAFFEKKVMGRVESLDWENEGLWRATIAFPVDATAREPAQLANVVFGNSSLHGDVQCVDVEPPPELLEALGGPRFGGAGLRRALGADGRPLTCTAIKPMGLSTAGLAELCGTFARAGVDVIKDDHGLADQPWSPFEERVEACLAAVREAAEATGHHAVYAPNLIGTPSRLREKLRFAEARGARAFLVSPMLVGLPAFWELAREASVPLLAHPAFAGGRGLEPAALFGRLFRLYGADAVIFVSFGSRFAAGRPSCAELAENLRRPWGGLLPSLPVPAGGIRLASVDEVVSFYGRDTMLLVGGDLQVEPDAVLERSRAFVDAVRAAGERAA